MRGGGADFITTRWSLIIAASESDEGKSAQAEAALNQLCHDYWPPLYSFVRRRGYSTADSQDLVQSFFVRLLDRRSYKLAEPSKGKFRAFLLTSMKNFLSDEKTYGRRLKRGGDQRFVLLNEELATVEAAHARESIIMFRLDEEQTFERRWATTLAASAMRRLKAKYASGPKARVFDALRPYLTGDEGADMSNHSELASILGIPVDTLRSYLSRIRVRYREFLREEVVRTLASGENVDEELRHLSRVLVAGPESGTQPSS